MDIKRVVVAAGMLALGAGMASAQVRYRPYDMPAPTPYGYPAPSGFLQPNEVLGTSPSYVIHPYAYDGRPVVSLVQRCQYPDGWNVTDFERDINGIPSGLDHTCPAPRLTGVRARY